jgi:hypothetical protein
MSSRKLTRLLAVGACVVAVGGGTYGIVSATASTGSGTPTTATQASATTTRGAFGKGQSNARSGPAAGGSSGTVTSTSKSGFTLSTSAGQKVTVKDTSATRYRKTTGTSSASAVKKGAKVLVLGTTNGTTITAASVIVQTSHATTPSSAAEVVPFQRGSQSTSKQAGQVPANYSQGSGTIVSGTTANKATEAALAAYPGGVVDRVVKLSNGEFEVHNIGVNWPHHIFVNQSFKVVGAN